MRVFPDLTVDGEFKALGDTGVSGSLNDRQYDYLGNSGYTGALPDRFGEYSGFTPASLFSTTGSRGFMFDFRDYNTLFTDTAGTTRVTSTNQAVGLALDKSQGLALGAELITNGGFSAGLTGWTLIGTGNTTAVSGGVAQISGTTSPGLRRAGILTVGLTYKISLRIRRTAGSSAPFFVPGPPTAPTLTGDWQTYTFYGVAAFTNFEVGISGAATGTVIEVDDISVRELAGNHATQATLGNRPLTTTIGSGYRGIEFDGATSNRWLQTAAIDFSNSDEVTVVAGLRKLSDAARGSVVELGNGSATNRFVMEAPFSAGFPYLFGSGGTTLVSVGPVTFAAPDTAIITGQGKVSTDTALIRRNGSQVASAATDQGTGNYSNAAVFIGRRAGTSLPFNGVLTFLFAINRLLTANELAAVEAYANGRTGAF